MNKNKDTCTRTDGDGNNNGVAFAVAGAPASTSLSRRSRSRVVVAVDFAAVDALTTVAQAATALEENVVSGAIDDDGWRTNKAYEVANSVFQNPLFDEDDFDDNANDDNANDDSKSTDANAQDSCDEMNSDVSTDTEAKNERETLLQKFKFRNTLQSHELRQFTKMLADCLRSMMRRYVGFCLLQHRGEIDLRYELLVGDHDAPKFTRMYVEVARPPFWRRKGEATKRIFDIAISWTQHVSLIFCPTLNDGNELKQCARVHLVALKEEYLNGVFAARYQTDGTHNEQTSANESDLKQFHRFLLAPDGLTGLFRLRIRSHLRVF